jgi:hypothetical protein
MNVFAFQGPALIDICCDAGSKRHADITEFYSVLRRLIHCLDSKWNTELNTKEVGRLSHLYFHLGVTTWGDAFLGNCSHILGAGHVTELLEMGYNLKHLEGQSTEHMVSLIKKLYHNKTQQADNITQVIRAGLAHILDDDSDFEDSGSESDDDKCADNDTDVSDDDDGGAYRNLLGDVITADGRTTRRLGTPAEGVKQRRHEGARRRNSAPT